MSVSHESYGDAAASIFPTSWDWQPPSGYRKITTIDTHTGGAPLRVPIAGLPPIYGNTVLEKYRYFKQNYDVLRSGLLLEPRGHGDMHGAILSTSKHPEADLDCIFINAKGYSTMCGHGTLAIVKVVFETGLIDKEGAEKTITIAMPAGLVFAKALVSNGIVTKTSFTNVPSFVHLLHQTILVPGIGEVVFDIAFGGPFFAFVDAQSLGVDLNTSNTSTVAEYGRKIKKVIVASPNIVIKHPFEEDLSGLFGVIFTGPAVTEGNHSRNVNVFEDGDVDRSACGTGSSARAALLFKKGELRVGEEIRFESIVGSVMSVKVLETTKFGGYDAVLPEVAGDAFITGKHELYFPEADPLREGFKL